MAIPDNMAMSGNWTNLPDHILELIMDRLVHSLPDYKCFGTICVSWRSAYNAHNPRLLPLLMVPPSFSTLTENSDRSGDNNKKKKNKKDIRRFYNIVDRKLDDTLKAIRMPHYRQCRGSSHGWLIAVDDVEFPVRLFNPFLSPSASSSVLLSSSSLLGNSKEVVEILLPSLDSFPVKRSILLRKLGYNFLHKAVLSANPISNPTDYRVMIIYGGGDSKLAFLKPGDKDWTPVTLPKIKNSREGYFEDVIYYQGKFLAIHCWGTVVVCDDTPQGMAARVLLQPPKQEHGLIKSYLVESSGGNLLQVHRHLDIGKPRRRVNGKPQGRLMYTTLGFKVYKLLLKRHQFTTNVQGITAEEDYEWVEMKSFGGDTVFLGDNASISICTSHYPGCKANCIYYTDDHCCFYKDEPESGPQDMGVFNLEDGSFERYYSTDFKATSISSPITIWQVPIWIQPYLQKRSN